MHDLSFLPTTHDFRPVRAAMQRYIDDDLLPGVSWAVLQGRELIDVQCVGWADREAQIPLTTTHLFRAFSNTKLITSCAVLLLMEAGKLNLDDPIERFLPPLGSRQVLRPGATVITDTEPAKSSITIRQLLSHSAGLSYGLFDPGTLIYRAYSEKKVYGPGLTLAEMVDGLAPLPLVFHPGTGFEYSLATDVLAHLVEVVSGERFDAFIKAHIFNPLGMVDTMFVVPPEKASNLTAYYRGADAMDFMQPGLTRIDHLPYPGAYLKPQPKLSGGGGLVTSLPDWVALMRSLLPGGPTLLKPDTIAMMMKNQLPDGVNIRFASFGEIVGHGFGLAGSVTRAPLPTEPAAAIDEFQWGGVAGTHWWISPRTGLTSVLMTQRLMAFGQPFADDFKRCVYRAMALG